MKDSEIPQNLLDEEFETLLEKVYQLPYFKNIQNDSIPIESYIGHLRTMAIVYGTLEHQLLKHPNHHTTDILGICIPKFRLIQKKLRVVKANSVKDILPAVNWALQIANKALLWHQMFPYKLLGCLYILERFQFETFELHQQLRTSLQLPNYQYEFSTVHSEGQQNFLRYFNKRLLHLSDGFKNELLLGMSEITSNLLALYNSLYPFGQEQLGNHISSINPEAGNHPIPTNPLEIESGIKAALKCWAEFPFYGKRYGERGQRFAVSDSVWLVTLVELEQDQANSQVNWLAKVLATRGMPTFTLETPLKYLYQELIFQLPENKTKYETLLKSAKMLESQRSQWISSSQFDESNSLFVELCSTFNTREKAMRNTGALIASSLIDTKRGVIESPNDYKTWISSPNLFDENWITAVDHTYAELETKINFN